MYNSCTQYLSHDFRNVLWCLSKLSHVAIISMFLCVWLYELKVNYNVLFSFISAKFLQATDMIKLNNSLFCNIMFL